MYLGNFSIQLSLLFQKNEILFHFPPSHRMPIALGTFTSSSRKFVDLSYRALLFIDA